MAKRKAGVNNIIFELDNEDIELSSDDEVKEAKINRLESSNSPILITDSIESEDMDIQSIPVDKSEVEIIDIVSTANIQNGGKTSVDIVSTDTENKTDSDQHKDVVDSDKKTTELCKTTILNEDIVIDSPGNSDLGVEGCENRTPLVTVRFKNNKLAVKYKQQIKAFMLNLIKDHEGESQVSDCETDLELDIWPEDLNDTLCEAEEEEVDNSLFFVDTDPGDDRCDDIPRYSQTSSVISNIPDKEPTPPPARRGPICFNCDGGHPLRDCPAPKDFARIAMKRKTMATRVGRYHVEDEQKFGHLIPGRMSGQLRHALGLKRHELPLHIYRMRLLGYPPGWLEEARISHSGISMFDSSGNAILEADDEEGEVIEPGAKDKFDIKKILDFPGFNVPPSPRYKEEGHTLGLPPMSDQDSKLAMLQFLAPNAMKAYKRKKLTMFPSATSNNTTLEGQAEMELDSGDELASFPSVPPLPDEAPPNPPPPPSCPPPVLTPPPPPPSLPPLRPPSPPQEELKEGDKTSEDDLEVIEVLKVGDIPIPMSDFIVIDEDDSEADKTENSDRGSPSLDDLEAKKQLLLSALEGNDSSVLDKTEEFIHEEADLPIDAQNQDESDNNDVDKIANVDQQGDSSKDIEVKFEKLNDTKTADESKIDIDADKTADGAPNADTISSNANKTNNDETQIEMNETNAQKTTANIDKTMDLSAQKQESPTDSQVMDSQATTESCQILSTQDSLSSSQIINSEESIIINSDSQESVTSLSQKYNSAADSETSKTSDNKTGVIKDTDYGTPVLNIASSYLKLPTDDKFAKDICDVINFENLPNSTGKYKKISALLKKVKNEVDRIQES